MSEDAQLVTAKHLRALFPPLGALAVAGYVIPLNVALIEYAITTPPRIAAFLAQIGHESQDLRTWHELWGPTPQQLRYEPPGDLAVDLGNTEPGDGFRYRGRGPLQITGRSNYRRAGLALGVDLEAHPELLDSPERGGHADIGFRSAGLFWLSRSLNHFADRETFEAFRWITKRINGGLTGLDDRLRRWREARAVLGLAPVPENAA